MPFGLWALETVPEEMTAAGLTVFTRVSLKGQDG